MTCKTICNQTSTTFRVSGQSQFLQEVCQIFVTKYPDTLYTGISWRKQTLSRIKNIRLCSNLF